MSHDYLIVGAGFAGSVMARQLAEAGKSVLLIDKRDHIGGNAYDYRDAATGVRIHKYGPHIFHTNSDKVFDYLSRFTEWRPYEHRVLSSVNGKLLPFPINLDTICAIAGREMDPEQAKAWVAADLEMKADIVTAEDQCLATVGRTLYDTFFKGYTEKMWGRPASELDKSVTARIPIRFNRDDRYFTDKHQVMPKDGYTAMFARMLDHPLIDVRTGCQIAYAHGLATHVVWTGPIDEYFSPGGKLGRLPYRSLRFDIGGVPPRLGTNAATVNYPDRLQSWTRITDCARLGGADEGGPMHITEYPRDEGEPCYPVPSPETAALYKRYEALALATPNVTFLGRLGSYRYYNMDQVVGQALACADRLLKREAA